MKKLFGLFVLFVCTSVSAYYPAAPQIVYRSSQVVYPTRQIVYPARQTVYPAQTVVYPSRQVVHNSRRVARVVRRRVVQTVPSVVYEEPSLSASNVQSPVFATPQLPVAPQHPDMLSLPPIVQSQTGEANEVVELRADNPTQSIATDAPVGESGESGNEASLESSARTLVEKCREELNSVPKWGWLGIVVLLLFAVLESWHAKKRA